MSFQRHGKMLVDCYRDLVETVRSATYRNARVGQAFALFGILAFLVGYGLFLAAESLGHASESYWTYRQFAGVLAGLGLPALLYGLLVALPDVGRNTYVSLVGAALCSAAVVLFFATYPGQWNVGGSPDYGIETVTLYGLGTMLCAAAAGGAVNCHFENEDITGFIWGGSTGR